MRPAQSYAPGRPYVCSGSPGAMLSAPRRIALRNPHECYLIFSVMIVSAARMIVMIQKRMVIFDSCTAEWGFFIR